MDHEGCIQADLFARGEYYGGGEGGARARRRLCRKIVPFRSFPCYLVNVGPMCTFQGLEHADGIIYFESCVRIFIFESGIFGGKRKRWRRGVGRGREEGEGENV